MPKRKAPPTAWKPGKSGNPEGSRGRKIMADALGLALNRKANAAGKKLCAGQDINPSEIRQINVIAEQLAKKAAGGDVIAIKEIFNRIDGKVPQAHDIKQQTSITVHAEAVSNFDRWLAGATAREANGADQNVGAERSVLPDPLPPKSTRH